MTQPTLMPEYEYEPVPGLPGTLPQGETMLWQGKPDWTAFAIRVFHARKVALWFGLLAAWRIATGLYDHAAPADILMSLTILAALGSVAVALLACIAYAIARSTVYTITTKRVVMRFGVALPMAVNLPFTQLAGAGVRVGEDGIGDIPLSLVPARPLSYIVLWPHARPGRFTRPEPMLRCLPDVAKAAAILGEAVTGTPQARAAQPAAAAASQGIPTGALVTS